MKKALRYICLGLFVLCLTVMIYIAVPKSSICDFRGYVTQVSIDDQKKQIYLTISEAANEKSAVRLKLTEKTVIRSLDGDILCAEQIRTGYLLDADVRDSKADGGCYTAEWIRVYL